MSYSFSCQRGNFSNDTSCEYGLQILSSHFTFIPFWYILHPNVYVMNQYHGWLKFGLKNHLESDSNCINYESIMSKLLYKEWQIMLG